ncbi:MAG TPA: RNA polymerase sigma factor [bacterium]|nr:RNA polymerase sigma factor [bacterium]HQP98427.1 RNA polymerase sigma factor [bacterium]
MADNLENGLQQGNPAAFERLFDLYADELLRQAYQMLGDPTDAEDIVQDALVGFVDALRTGRFHGGNGTLYGYLKTTVRNLCINLIRQRGHLHIFHRPDCNVPHVEIDPLRDLPSGPLDSWQIQQGIERAIEKLPAVQRAVIVMRIMEDLSYQQIAHELGISIDHVKNTLARARKQMREDLEPLIHEGKLP